MLFHTDEHSNMMIIKSFIPFLKNEEFYVCIYAQRDCDTILFHHEGGVEIGDVDSKVKYFNMFCVVQAMSVCVYIKFK